MVMMRLKTFLSEDRFTTAISEAELRLGLSILPRGRKRHALQSHVDGILRKVFAGGILPFDSSAAQACAEIAAERRTAGRLISQSDAPIAAIARVQGATLVTRDIRDFEGCRFPVINPWAIGFTRR
jgi:predicted nucleic acid-binding protein